MSLCTFPLCQNYREGNTNYCATHNHAIRKAEREALKPSKIKKTLQKFSEKMKVKLKTYRELRKEYLIGHPLCLAKLAGCTKKAVDVHHLSGRGSKLNVEETFLAVCRNCHDVLHNKLSATERRNKKLML